jgi:UDP-N-acetylmuramoyl-tripeptide--D-alanyl-D-alanine ligase
MFDVRHIAQIVRGELIRGTDEVPRAFTHDSRRVEQGDVFVALLGARVDGHAFLCEAFERGACGAIVSDRSQAPASSRNLIVVSDPLRSLQTLAAAWRKRLDVPIVAITGSNGKTTTKAFLAHLLRGDYRTHVAPGNYNTEIGLALSVLAMPRSAEVGVFELAADKPGDIRALANLLHPTIGLVTDVGPSHLRGFQTLDAVADEKWHLVRALPPDGLAMVNADSARLRTRARSENHTCLTVGLGHGTLRGKVVCSVPRLTIDVGSPALHLESPLIGAHNAANLLLAVAAALKLGVSGPSIERRTRSFSPPHHRLQPLATPFGTVLDDTYNANPASTAAALRVLAALGNASSFRTFVFGDMLDLGNAATRYHRETVRLALDLGIDILFPVGEHAEAACQSAGLDRSVLTDPSSRGCRIRSHLAGTNNIVLVKGSRALGLDVLVRELTARPTAEG